MQVDLVQVTTRDGVRLDGMLQRAVSSSHAPADGVIFVHGTGGNFYASALFDVLGERFLQRGIAVLRVNTRGHDGISNAVTSKGGRRLGAAYECVDDCRHDLAAWVDFLKAAVGPRVILGGHSLGAVKCIYALAQDDSIGVERAIAISPPRLSYAWFCENPEGPRFLESYRQSEALIQAGTPSALLEVSLPLPMAITAAGYVEKYGPDERYNFLQHLRYMRVPTLVTFGGIEVANNMAFRAAPEAVAELASTKRPLSVATIAEADHFYTGKRAELCDAIVGWL